MMIIIALIYLSILIAGFDTASVQIRYFESEGVCPLSGLDLAHARCYGINGRTVFEHGGGTLQALGR